MKTKRLPITINEKQQDQLEELATKYNKSQAEILRIGLCLLVEQERAGFDIPRLKSKR